MDSRDNVNERKLPEQASYISNFHNVTPSRRVGLLGIVILILLKAISFGKMDI